MGDKNPEEIEFHKLLLKKRTRRIQNFPKLRKKYKPKKKKEQCEILETIDIVIDSEYIIVNINDLKTNTNIV